MNSRIMAVARVQSAKLRRRKLVMLFGLAPFALSLLFVGPALLIFSNVERGGADLGPMFKFGMILGWGAFLSVAGSVLALLLGATAIERDISDATLFPVLAKPVSRSEVLLGKFIGSGFVILFYLALEALIILAATSQAGAGTDWWQVLRALASDALRYGTFLSLGLLVGIVMRPAVGVSVVAGGAIWILLLDNLLQSHSDAVRIMGLLPLALFPHTEFWGGWFDTTSMTLVVPAHWAACTSYVILWGWLFLALARWRFERRELVSQ